MRKFTAIAVALALGVVYLSTAHADEAAKPKHTTKEVMKEGHKGGLLKKVISGDATNEEKLLLVDLYASMWENKPPKGEADSWNKLAGASLLAATKVLVGREGATAELKKATNCKACHSQHKGD